METSTFLEEVPYHVWEKQEYSDDNFSDCNYKHASKKLLFGLQSPILSYESIPECEGSGFEVQDQISVKLEESNESQEKFSQNSKKTKKDIKSRMKKQRLLNESEFIRIVKQIEQCQQVRDLIDNMASVIRGFHEKLQEQRTQSFKRVK